MLLGLHPIPITPFINKVAKHDVTKTLALMETDVGTIEIKLFEADAPNTVANFIKLAKEGFYDGLAFHRVIPGFMAQGGCPNSREGARGIAGTGGPGYFIKCEISSRRHQSGSLAMAHAGKNTGGSQFYICHGPQPHLDGVHTVFAQTANMDVVNALQNGTRINNVSILSLPASPASKGTSTSIRTEDEDELDLLLRQAEQSITRTENPTEKN
jgi:peptidyl-prolyl cis-trans isomerase B (cyclophilin B)